jgi:hypothetical protein
MAPSYKSSRRQPFTGKTNGASSVLVPVVGLSCVGCLVKQSHVIPTAVLGCGGKFVWRGGN